MQVKVVVVSKEEGLPGRPKVRTVGPSHLSGKLHDGLTGLVLHEKTVETSNFEANTGIW